VSIIFCNYYTPRARAQQCLLIAQNAGSPTPKPANASCTHICIVGGEYRGAKHQSIQMGTENFSVTAFEISHALIDGADLNGILILNSYRGTVIGNHIMGCLGFGIQEVAPANKNLILGNYLHSNGTPLLFAGADTQAVRNYVDAGVALVDSGGFRQTIDGWEYLGIGPNQVIDNMTRANGRFRAVRSGSITGLVVTISQPRTGTTGTLKVTAYKNPGNAGVTGSTTSFFVEINANVNRAALPQPVDISTSKFSAGDELYLRVETSGFVVASPPFNVFAALEIED
jgi:hypothetical protein